MLTRRNMVRFAAAAALTPAWKALGAWDEEPMFFEWKEAAAGVWVGTGGGGNSMLVKGKDGALLVDCKNAPYGVRLRKESEAHCKPIRVVVNTHHHADHTGGNHAFSKDIEIIAQDNATARILGQMNRYLSQLKEAAFEMEAAKGPAGDLLRAEAKALYLRHSEIRVQEFAPKTTFPANRDIDMGGTKVKLVHFGPGHTDNDLVVFLPDANVLHTGDLLFHRRHPYVDRAGGADTRGWQSAVRRAAELCNPRTVVVPGHGETTDVKGLLAQVEYFDRMREAVEKAVRAGKSRKEVAEMNPDAYREYETGARTIALGALFDELAESSK